MPEKQTKIPASLVLLLACGAGFSVGGIYYNQPILGAIAADLHATPGQVGLVPTLTQLGYAFGIVLFAPLGDTRDRRQVIVLKSIGLCLALLGAAFAPTIHWLAAASFSIGLLATTAQDFVPAAAALSPPKIRGKIVGSVMTGLLLGILLSRLASGVVAERFGWRSVFVAAAASIAILAAVARLRLPTFSPSVKATYPALLKSIAVLARDVKPLQRAALSQSLLCIAFSAFWSTLALALQAAPYHLGSTGAGAFGLAGAAGALIAPVAGSIADKRGPLAVVRVGMAIVVASFLMMLLLQGSLVILVIGTVTFDLGVQASLISHQTIIYSLDPAARSRLNAVLVSTMFLGMSAGAVLGSNVLARYGFGGVMALAIIAASLAFVARSLPVEQSVRT